MSKLNPRQERFVEEYLKDLNATQAYVRAGYSEKGAEVQACKLLRNPKVADIIAARKKERSERTKIDADWLLKRLADESEADVADLYDDAGKLLPVRSWPKVWRQGLVAGIDTSTVGDAEVVKIRLADRTRIKELIGKHVDVGAFKDQVVLPGTINLIVNRPSGA